MLISKRSLILGAGAAFITRPALALKPSICRGPFNARKLGPVNPVCFVVPNGLIAYWPFSGETTDFAHNLTFDASGGGNTGTLSGLALPSLSQGQVGNALLFGAGGTSGAYVGTSLVIPSSFSIALWINYSTSVNYGSIGTNDNNNGLYLRGGAGGVLDYYFNADHLSATPLTANAWHHACITVNAGGLLQFYIDGMLDANTYSSIGAFTLTSIGNAIVGGSAITGSMCDFRVYNRAIDPWEVTTLYRAGLAGRRI